MFENLCIEVAAWWTSITPAFAFLLALPFIVGGAGVMADMLRRRKSK